MTIYPTARPAFAAAGALALAFSVCTAGANAQSGPLETVIACADIEDGAARLACYDEQVANLRASVRSGELVAVDRPAVEAIERDGFGFSLPSLPRLSLSLFAGRGDDGGSATASAGATAGASASERGIAAAENTSGVEVIERGEDGQVERVLMTIARADMVSPNQYRFTMENGQVWTQVDAGRRISTRAVVGGEAEIRRAAMGSFIMRINGEGQTYRVSRVR
ncbi:MAG: hypothetical protein ACQRW7_03480 [Caulobacterales bacterium]|uniref:hypothetical protein n=1 Tax=Glycocaulis sp. TaxID=1969725 RepID=UPI003FA104E7